MKELLKTAVANCAALREASTSFKSFNALSRDQGSAFRDCEYLIINCRPDKRMPS